MTKRTNDILTSYEFIQDRYATVLKIIRYKKRRALEHRLTDASYARFVALVNNSDRYFITILDEGIVGWRIRRKPIMCEHNNYIDCPFGCDPNGLTPTEVINHRNPTPDRPN